MRVADVMAGKGPRVITARPETTIAAIVHLMKIERVGAIVITRDETHALGVISERDIIEELAAHGGELLQASASDTMRHPVLTCRPEDSVKSVLSRMTMHRVRHMPVLEGGVLRGIISIGDAVKCRLTDMELETVVLRDAYLANR